MKISNTIEHLARLGVSDEDKILYLYVASESPDNKTLEISNAKIAGIFYKHSTNISKSIRRLINASLLVRLRLNGKRVLALSDYANSLIIKNNKINKNNLFIHKDNTININNCDDISNDLICTDDIVLFDHNIICKWLLENPKPFKNVKTAIQLKAVIRSVLNKAKKENKFPQAMHFEFELAEIELKNTIRQICGYQQELIEVDEEELKKNDLQERHRRVLLKGIKESYIEKIIDITKNPDELQNTFRGQKLVTIEGSIQSVYEGGTPPFCNIKLKPSNSNQLVYACILSKHFTNLKAELDEYQGMIKVTGRVFASTFHKKNYDVYNIIQSIDELKPIDFLDRSGQLNTKLHSK